MAKAILEFDLNDFDDNMAHLRAVKSLDMALVIFELTSNLKKRISYELEHRELKDWEVLDLVFERIHELVNDHGIIIDELTR
mgnify:FL=1